MIGAGAVLLPGTQVPGGQLWSGNPAIFMRNLTDADIAALDKVCSVVWCRVGDWALAAFNVRTFLTIMSYNCFPSSVLLPPEKPSSFDIILNTLFLSECQIVQCSCRRTRQGRPYDPVSNVMRGDALIFYDCSFLFVG